MIQVFWALKKVAIKKIRTLYRPYGTIQCTYLTIHPEGVEPPL